jgi:hypothetical protein
MKPVVNLRTYGDIRSFVNPKAFQSAMSYISWHNRLTMTPMLEVWEALIVSLAFEQKPIEPFLFGAVKNFLDTQIPLPPGSVDDCQKLSVKLWDFLAGSSS